MVIGSKEACFSEIITDPRQKGKIKHSLENIMTITICAVICGANGWEDIGDFGVNKREWLSNIIELPSDGSTPSADTVARLFHAIKANEFERYFLAWIDSLIKRSGNSKNYISIDGKTLRRSYDKKSDKSSIHMVSAWSSVHSCVLGQIKTEEKSNEITAIPKLLEVLEIKEAIVTIDAMGTQKKIASSIINNQGDYILAVKSNQPTLENEIVNYFDTEFAQETLNNDIKFFSEIDKGHGRLEDRKYWISEKVDFFSKEKEWKGLKSVGMTESTRTVDEITTVQKKYYITSTSADIQTFAGATRKHWGIENSLHWCLDVGFREDECRIRKGNASENMAIVRHIALNMLKRESSSKKGIARKRLNAAQNDNYLENILGL